MWRLERPGRPAIEITSIHTLGRADLGPQFVCVSRKQATIQLDQDECILHSTGTNATAVRRGDTEIHELSKEIPMLLNAGDEIWLDKKDNASILTLVYMPITVDAPGVTSQPSSDAAPPSFVTPPPPMPATPPQSAPRQTPAITVHVQMDLLQLMVLICMI